MTKMVVDDDFMIVAKSTLTSCSPQLPAAHTPLPPFPPFPYPLFLNIFNFFFLSSWLVCFSMAFVGKCMACEKAVYLVKLTAGDRVYHKACFRCHHCKGTLKLSTTIHSMEFFTASHTSTNCSKEPAALLRRDTKNC